MLLFTHCGLFAVPYGYATRLSSPPGFLYHNARASGLRCRFAPRLVASRTRGGQTPFTFSFTTIGLHCRVADRCVAASRTFTRSLFICYLFALFVTSCRFIRARFALCRTAFYRLRGLRRVLVGHVRTCRHTSHARLPLRPRPRLPTHATTYTARSLVVPGYLARIQRCLNTRYYAFGSTHHGSPACCYICRLYFTPRRRFAASRSCLVLGSPYPSFCYTVATNIRNTFGSP